MLIDSLLSQVDTIQVEYAVGSLGMDESFVDYKYPLDKQSAFKDIDCYEPGCYDGGFNFSPLLWEMISERREVKEGKLMCM